MRHVTISASMECDPRHFSKQRVWDKMGACTLKTRFYNGAYLWGLEASYAKRPVPIICQTPIEPPSLLLDRFLYRTKFTKELDMAYYLLLYVWAPIDIPVYIPGFPIHLCTE